MTDLPDGWEWSTLATVCGRLRYGWTTRSQADGHGLQLLRITDMTSGVVDWRKVPWCVDTPSDAERFLLRTDDIVIARSGATFGRSYLAIDPPACVFASYLIRLRPIDVSARYVYWFLQSAMFWRQAESAKAGMAQPNLNATKIGGIVLPVAPRLEQDRIVAAIEEHLSRLDAAEAALASALVRVRTLEKAIITTNASTLHPPAHWKQFTVGDAGKVGLGLQRAPKRHSGPNMRPYLRVANVFEDRIDDGDVMTMDMSETEWERYRLRDGDVLLNEGQSPELLGRPAIYRGQPPEIAFTNSLIRFQAGEGIDPEWALLVFRSHMHNRRFMQESQITTNIAHLAAGRFKTVEFPVPPPEEQAERVATARGGLDACDRMRSATRRETLRAAGLRRAILAAAFSGRLVPQDPDDEPAAVLLERIRAERAAAAPPQRTRKARSA